MPEGDQDHCRIVMPVAVLPSRGHQRLDLMLCQIFAGSQLAVLRPPWHNCSVYNAWND